jgi:signal transduction histidine kinase
MPLCTEFFLFGFIRKFRLVFSASMQSLYLWFTLSMLCLSASGQSFTVYNYSIPEGLPSAEVYEVFQDSDGFIWFGTDNGIARFDGSEMETFHTKDGLSDPVVFTFFEDHRQRIWFRTFSGNTSYYEKGKIKVYPYNHILQNTPQIGLIRFIVNKKNQLVFSTWNIIGTIDSLGNVIERKIDPAGIHYYKIDDYDLVANNLVVDRTTDLYLNNAKFTIELSKKIKSNRTMCSTHWNGDLYLSLHHNLFKYDGNKVEIVLDGDNPIINLSVDRDNNLWVGFLNEGVKRYSTDDFKEHWTPDFLKDLSVTKVLHDHEGGFWFSTLESGVFHLPNLSIENFPIPTTSRVKDVTQSKNEVFIGDQRGMVYSIKKNEKQLLHQKSFSDPIISLYYSESEKLLISTNQNLHRVNLDFTEDQKFPGMVNDFSYLAPNVWGYGARRLRKFDRDLNQTYVANYAAPYRCLLVENDTAVYLADRIGMHIKHARDTAYVFQPNELSKFKISDIIGFNDSTLLVTTLGNGFALWNKYSHKIKTFDTQNNFLAENIYCSVIANEHIWLSTERGLIKIPSTSVLEDSLSIQYLTKKSGLVSDRIDFLEVVGNSIWAFSDRAYSVIPLTTRKFSNASPLFYLREFKVNDSLRNIKSTIELPYNQNNITVKFGYISYNNPHIFIRYRLKPENPWINTNTKSLLFSSLTPGNYSFELQHSTDNIHYVASTPTVTFNILLPWWDRWYTYLAVALVLLFLGYLYFRYQQSIYRQKNKFLEIINSHQQRLIQSEIVALERERNRISKELHDRVGTNLTAIKLTVNQLLEKHTQESASEVEQQFQIAIQEIKDIIYGLTPPSLERYGLFTGLKNYIAKLQRNIPIKIAIKTFGKEVDDYELNIIVFRIIQELITNSIKHSFAKEITIHLSSFEDVLNILYEDNGVGFSYDPVQSGLGLDNIESRIQSLNGSVKFESGEFGISYAIDIPLVKKEAS